MEQRNALPPYSAIIVAAGKGMRAGGSRPKQFCDWGGKMLVKYSIETLSLHGADPLIVVIPEITEDLQQELSATFPKVRWIKGGDTRQDSVRDGLEALAAGQTHSVLIHDAARPDIPEQVIVDLLHALADHEGAIPTLPVVDSLAVASEDNVMLGKADRETLRRVQTPQAFRFAAILAAHRAWPGPTDAGDDAQVLMASNGSVALVQGDERLRKITFAEDFKMDTKATTVRVGQGFDVHRLVEGEELWLCGIQLDHTHGLSGHSDADVALHAVTDAVLGGIGAGDIGTHFPPSDPQWAGARSGQFLEHAVKLAKQAAFEISNIDLTLICEAPKIGPHRPAMRTELARITNLAESKISIKATTTERLGFAGRGEGIAAQAIVSLQST